MCFVVPDVLGRLVGFVAPERKGVPSGWILRDEGFASKSRIRWSTLEKWHQSVSGSYADVLEE
jgi:hypothetical protein